MPTTDHPRVDEWLRQFDAAARSLPASRRTGLRRELHSHLTDSIPAGTDDAIATIQLEEFGDPRDIIDQELPAMRATGPLRRPRTGWWIAGAALLVVVALVIVVVSIPKPTGTPESNGPVVTSGSVVNADPQGPARVSSGQGYEEYVREIDQLPALPASATWPTGVPEGLDAGVTDAGVMSTGGGAFMARFTWLCAWEWEYLDAENRSQDSRLVDAYAALKSWPEANWQQQADPTGSWETKVLDPLQFNDSRGLRSVFPLDCEQASILGVPESVEG